MKLTRDRLKQIIKEELEEMIGQGAAGFNARAEEDRERKINHALRTAAAHEDALYNYEDNPALFNVMLTNFKTELKNRGVTDLNNPEQVLQDYIKNH